MPRFALLRHQSPRGLHWDFFLEVGGVLRTWALHEAPQDGKTIEADSLGEHRLAYLDYEGPVSNDRGHVNHWDDGEYTTESQSDDQWVVLLTGRWLRGRAVLRRVSAAGDAWQFVFHAGE